MVSTAKNFNQSQIISEKKTWLNSDSFLAPFLENDAFLFSLDDDEDDFESTTQNIDFTKLDISSSSSTDKDELILQLTKRLKESDFKLKSCIDAFDGYRESVKETFLKEDVVDEVVDKKNETQAERDQREEKELDYYFGSYAENEIHEQMLKDKIRTDSYRDFCYENKSIFKDKVVLDVGCGTGILSMFAAKAGAKMVIAVDNSTVIKKARQNVKENGLDSIITFVQGEIEKIILPVDEVDIIISEWMGYFLLYEGMLDSVIFARDKYLAPDGFMAPSQSEIFISAISDEEWINDSYNFWNNVYGFKMSCMQKGFLDDAQIDFANSNCLISIPQSIKKIDMNIDSSKSLDFKSKFNLKINKKARITGLVAWFDILFSADQKDVTEVRFSTGPESGRTHWKQTTFVFENRVECEIGWSLEGEMECMKNMDNGRELEVEIMFKVLDLEGVIVGEGIQKFRIR